MTEGPLKELETRAAQAIAGKGNRSRRDTCDVVGREIGVLVLGLPSIVQCNKGWYMQDLSYQLGGPLDQFMASLSPVIGGLGVIFLLAVFCKAFVAGNTSVGDYLDRLWVFNYSISKRPKQGKTYRHPPRSRVSLTQAMVVVGCLALGLMVVVGWTMWSLSRTLIP